MSGARVTALWRYPVKSMLGESLPAVTVLDGGLLGDRRYALVDLDTGTIASAKHPRRWKALLTFRARYLAEPGPDTPAPIEISASDGSSVRSDDPGASDWLSAVLGRGVRLVSSPMPAAERDTDRSPLDQLESGRVIQRERLALLAPSGSFLDVAPIHVLSSSALAVVAAPVERFRPNVLVSPGGPDASVDELGWIGREIRIGNLPLAVLDPTPRCVLTTLPQRGLPPAPALLRAIHAASSAVSRTAAPGFSFSGVLGVYARADLVGTLRVGDEVHEPCAAA